MLLNLGGPLVSSHAALYPLLPHARSLPQPMLASSAGLKLTQQQSIISSSISSRRRTRPSSASSGPRSLHPSGGGPEGVPSSLFKFQPRGTPKKYQQQPSSGGGGSDGGDGTATTVEREGPLYAGLIEESDLPDVSALLVGVSKISRHFAFSP